LFTALKSEEDSSSIASESETDSAEDGRQEMTGPSIAERKDIIEEDCVFIKSDVDDEDDEVGRKQEEMGPRL